LIIKEYDRRFIVVATGGWAKKMTDQLIPVDHHDPDLVLYGIYRIFLNNDRNL
jgi:pantothenate kinase type III